MSYTYVLERIYTSYHTDSTYTISYTISYTWYYIPRYSTTSNLQPGLLLTWSCDRSIITYFRQFFPPQFPTADNEKNKTPAPGTGIPGNRYRAKNGSRQPIIGLSLLLLGVLFYFLFFIFFDPIYYLRPSTQIRGHIAGSFPPLSTTDRALHFYREKISALSSLVDSRRIVLTHARRSQQLILFLFLQINSKSRHGGIRTHGPTLVAFEGYHY